MICWSHGRHTRNETCPGCNGTNVEPDASLLATFDAAGFDGHERGRVSIWYKSVCWDGDKTKIEAAEKWMRAKIVSKTGKL